MSNAAEWIRKRMLRSQITHVQQQSRDLWMLIQVTGGMGGIVPPVTVERFFAAVSESERLALEYQASL